MKDPCKRVFFNARTAREKIPTENGITRNITVPRIVCLRCPSLAGDLLTEWALNQSFDI